MGTSLPDGFGTTRLGCRVSPSHKRLPSKDINWSVSVGDTTPSGTFLASQDCNGQDGNIRSPPYKPGTYEICKMLSKGNVGDGCPRVRPCSRARRRYQRDGGAGRSMTRRCGSDSSGRRSQCRACTTPTSSPSTISGATTRAYLSSPWSFSPDWTSRTPAIIREVPAGE